MEDADEAFTPSIVLAELARKYHREGMDSGVVRSWLRGISEATEIHAIDIELSMMSAQAAADLTAMAHKEGISGPGLGDALVLATARALNARVVTGDPHFKGLEETVWLGA